jgi:aspartate/methionine/tyrosine aminotransferase
MYAPTKGVPMLLELIEKKLRNENKIDVNWKDNIILTNGGSQALMLAYASIFNTGDELIVSSPNFISYFYLGSFFGVKVIEIERNKDFSPNLEEMNNAITDKTKAILINTPNNPTGNALNSNELDDIIEIVLKNDLYLISDEVYEKYIYDGDTHTSPASKSEMFERTITVNAMSKTYSATGFRLGYAAANREIIELMEKFHQYTVAGTNHSAQYGFIEALKMELNFFEPVLKSFEERRNFMYEKLKSIGFDVVKPKGAFYIMPSVKNFNTTGAEFSTKVMKEKGVAVVPGNIFGSYSNDKVRMSYATELSKLKEAMDRIESLVHT